MIEKLPNEIQSQIFNYLEVGDLLNAAEVTPSWRKFILRDKSLLKVESAKITQIIDLVGALYSETYAWNNKDIENLSYLEKFEIIRKIFYHSCNINFLKEIVRNKGRRPTLYKYLKQAPINVLENIHRQMINSRMNTQSQEINNLLFKQEVLFKPAICKFPKRTSKVHNAKISHRRIKKPVLKKVIFKTKSIRSNLTASELLSNSQQKKRKFETDVLLANKKAKS